MMFFVEQFIKINTDATLDEAKKWVYIGFIARNHSETVFDFESKKNHVLLSTIC